MSSTSSTKILWLSILQGWAMLLVVIGHVNFYEFMAGGSGATADPLHRFAYAFHMPLFMFVSGGLFFLTRIDRRRPYRSVVADKARRLLIPYAVFTLLSFLLKASFGGSMKRAVVWSLSDFFSAFLFPAAGPMAEMWFVAALFLLMLLYPLYCRALASLPGRLILVGLAIVAYCLAPLLPEPIALLFALREACSHAIYFVAGMLCFKYGLTDRLASPSAAIVATILFFASLLAGRLPIVTPFLGVAMSIALCRLLAPRFPALFASFRDFTFQIYLIGLYPQMLLELFLWPRVAHSLPVLITLYLLSIVLALYLPVALSRLALRSRLPILTLPLALK